jgi:hypothetical protein
LAHLSEYIPFLGCIISSSVHQKEARWAFREVQIMLLKVVPESPFLPSLLAGQAAIKGPFLYF